jgi:hypothetical protein
MFMSSAEHLKRPAKRYTIVALFLLAFYPICAFCQDGVPNLSGV